MRRFAKFLLYLTACSLLCGCLVTTVIGGAVSAVTTTVGAAVDVVDTVTPDITD